MRIPAPPAGLVLLTIAGLAFAPPARAAGDEPDRGRPAEAPAQSAEAIQAPAAPLLPADGLPYGPLELLTLNPVDPLDRGSDLTDAGLDAAPAMPSALEEAKLAMARAAVEASRAAGTLYVIGPQPAALAPPEMQRAAKLDRLRSQPPVPMPDLAGPAGVGGGLEPLQLIGPSAPSAEELAKLETSYPATSNPAPPADPAARAETAAPAPAADPQQAQDAEVQR